MKDATAIYLGQIVSKKNFRVYIYAPDGSQKLVESWDAYEKHMETGLWFPTKEEALKSIEEVVEEKPKPKPRQTKAKKPEVKEVAESLLEAQSIEMSHDESVTQDSAFEVSKEDDFLPKTAS